MRCRYCAAGYDRFEDMLEHLVEYHFDAVEAALETTLYSAGMDLVGMLTEAGERAVVVPR